jgi:hypothetical protein
MPFTDKKLQLKAKYINGSDRLTVSHVLTDLASPAISRTAVYANGLKINVLNIRKPKHVVSLCNGACCQLKKTTHTHNLFRYANLKVLTFK